ncbi:hypothetical protein PG989_006655 [Apiospora arundinis]
MLKERETTDELFDSETNPYLGFLELRDGEEVIISTVLHSQIELEAHLQLDANNPRFRYIERSADPTPIWVIRQLVVYHAFDVINGKALWITVKGTEETKKHVYSEFSDNSGMRPNSAEGTPANFNATLRMQLLSLNPAMKSPLDTKPHNEAVLEDIRLQTFRRENINAPPPPSAVETLLSTIRTGVSRLLSRRGKSSSPQTEQLNTYQQRDWFSFSMMQRLQEITETIQESVLAVDMNATVLRDVKAYYEKLMNSKDMPSEIKSECKPEVGRFLQKVEINPGVQPRPQAETVGELGETRE